MMTSIFEANNPDKIEPYSRLFEPYIADMGLWRIRSTDSKRVPAYLADAYTNPTIAKKAIISFIAEQDKLAEETAKYRKRKESEERRVALEAVAKVEDIKNKKKEDIILTAKSKSEEKRLKVQAG